jgi:hypothetical protein
MKFLQRLSNYIFGLPVVVEQPKVPEPPKVEPVTVILPPPLPEPKVEEVKVAAPVAVKKPARKPPPKKKPAVKKV